MSEPTLTNMSTLKKEFESFKDEIIPKLYVVELGRASGLSDEDIFKVLAEEVFHSMSNDELCATTCALVIMLSDAIKAARQLAT